MVTCDAGVKITTRSITPASPLIVETCIHRRRRHHVWRVYRVCVMAMGVAGPTVGGMMGNGIGRTDR